MRLGHLFYTVPLRLRSLFRRQQVEQDLEDELRFHMEQRIEEEMARGASAVEAQRPPGAPWTVWNNAKRSAAT